VAGFVPDATNLNIRIGSDGFFQIISKKQ